MVPKKIYFLSLEPDFDVTSVVNDNLNSEPIHFNPMFEVLNQ